MKFALYMMTIAIFCALVFQCGKASESAQTLLRIEDVLRSQQRSPQ